MASERCVRRDKQRNLERILQAAKQLVSSHGASVTIEEVAREAGVGVGTIYRCFPRKELLLAAVSDHACANACAEIAHAQAATPEPRARLQAVIGALYREGEGQANLLAVGLDEADPALCANHNLSAALHQALAKTIAEGQCAGAIRAGDPQLLAVICAVLVGPQTIERIARHSPVPATQLAQLLSEIVVAGLANPPPAEPPS